jgi:DNA repair exonuclease SbcCD ATPase subunit
MPLLAILQPTNTTTVMQILELKVTDLKRIEAIEIDPATGQPIILTGDNAQGKSSVLDAILLALTNTGMDDPIRHGRQSGSVRLTIGGEKVEYTLERRLTKKGSYLTLLDADGKEVPKAQTFLNGLLGNYAFDPLEFTRLKPKQQVDALKSAAGLDFAELDAERQKFFDDRTNVGRTGKEAAAALTQLPKPAEDAPAEETSATELIAKLREMEGLVSKYSQCKLHVETATANHASALQEVARLEAALATAKELVIERETEKKHAEEFLAEIILPTAEDIQSANDAIDNVEANNRKVRERVAYIAAEKKADDLRTEYATLTRRIQEIDERKAEAVKSCSLPIPGLELTDDGVLMSGVLFDQLSTAEQIRISTLVAMSQNPQLKIILIREGALMNSANLKLMSDLAAERGYQLWIEKFQEAPGQVGLHIVDGSIAFVDGKPVE